PIGHIKARVGYDELVEDARRVLRTLTPAEREIDDPESGARYIARVLPYRSTDNFIAGVVVTFVDVTARRAAEERLRESEARFRALVTAGTYMTYRMSPDWQQMYQLSGRGVLADTTEPVESWIDTYLLPEDRPMIFAVIEEAIRTKSLFELEHRVRRADEGVGWVLSRAVPILGPGGEIVEWFGAGSDVTARREAQEALRETEARYRTDLERQVRERTAELQASRDLLQATMDASTDMIQVFEAVRDAAGAIVDFRWVLNNHTSESRFGDVGVESLLQRNPGVIVEGIFDAFKRVVETGEPEQAERHYVHEQFDGWFFQSVVKLGDGVATTTKDITAWKAAQQEVLRLQAEVAQARLEESEERFRLIVESARDYAIFTTDTDGLITEWPPGAQAVFGGTPEEMVGRNVAVTFVPEDVAAGVPEHERRTAREAGHAANVRWHRRMDGARVFIEGSVRPLRDAKGRVTGYLKIGQDVTGARRVQ
ncbi:MAG: PAS domain S-box protein, partial [Gammaproteobacteria bacterium]